MGSLLYIQVFTLLQVATLVGAHVSSPSSRVQSQMFIGLQSGRSWPDGVSCYQCRAESLPQELVPEMTEAIEKVGLHWEDFKLVNNSCPPHPEESLISNIVGGIEDINPTEVKPKESPVDIGQGPKFSYMDSDKSSKVEKPAAVANKDDEGGLTVAGPK